MSPEVPLKGFGRVSHGGGPIVVGVGDSDDARPALVGGSTFVDLPGLLDAVEGDVGRIEFGESFELDGAQWLRPVAKPPKVVCIGVNYRDHAAEGGRVELPEKPVVFAKWDTALTDPFADVPLPPESDKIDWESELAFVFGKRCRRVRAGDAADVVLGYAASNDVSVRDFQMHSSQWQPGKSWDDSTPVGPYVVLTGRAGGIRPELQVVGRLNGEVMQSGSTKDLIFGVPEIVEYVTTFMTMEPGDLVLTGTMAGVGFARDPKVLLRDGDVFEVEIEGIGAVRNTFVAES